jgi:acyl CoA:acetate/3-ketoacid CoA transferase beta subunit
MEVTIKLIQVVNVYNGHESNPNFYTEDHKAKKAITCTKAANVYKYDKSIYSIFGVKVDIGILARLQINCDGRINNTTYLKNITKGVTPHKQYVVSA